MGAGLSADEALSQASQIADALVDHGTSLRIAQLEKRLAKADPKFEREKTRDSIRRNLADAKSGKYKRSRSFLGSYWDACWCSVAHYGPSKTTCYCQPNSSKHLASTALMR